MDCFYSIFSEGAMDDFKVIGSGYIRKESRDKVTGAAKYTNDHNEAGMLHARMVTSTYAHADIKSIDVSGVWTISGVRAVITGEYYPHTTGTYLKDRYPIAYKESDTMVNL
jgi:CO/xanthine dehydrogenase Mo-binding subunit